MYYVIERDYELEDDQHTDSHMWFITTSPALGNMSREPVIDGWAGTTDGWIVHAHGEYETLEAARAALLDLSDPCRDCDYVDKWTMPAGTVEAYFDGAFEPLCREATVDWAYEGIVADVHAGMSDAELNALCGEYEKEAREQGYTLHWGALLQAMEEQRDAD